MAVHVALLRAVNVGGTGKLPMTELRALCEKLGFERVTTFIASGNVVFDSPLSEPKVKAALEKALERRLGKPVGVLVRNERELAATLAANPFEKAPPNRVIVFFLDEPPPAAAMRDVKTPGNEELAARGREIFVHYPVGQGVSKLKVPLADRGTGRNVNTVRKLLELARAHGAA
jgi:uncharacterized protein (DUF1697 family)